MQQTSMVQYAATPNFAEILEHLRVSLLISTYQAGKLISIGSRDNQLQFAFHGFDQVMGVAVGKARIAVGTRRQICFLNSNPDLAPYIEPAGQFDSCWLSRLSFQTGSIHVHDLAWGDDGLWAVNTLFSCLCTFSSEHNFVPSWKPPFISQLIDQDRCHLNGLAMDSGKPRFVTVLSESDTAAGWRNHKIDGGAVIDVPTNQVIVRGLCMPHSPRLHQGQLWVLNSGHGQLGRIEQQSGCYQAVAELPGYTRGLSLVGNIAFVGLSRIRETNIFGGLPISEHPDELCCGVGIVDINTGRTVATLRFLTGVEEIFAVETIQGSCNPKIAGPGALEPDEKEIWVVPQPAERSSAVVAYTEDKRIRPKSEVKVDVAALIAQATADQQQGRLESAFIALKQAFSADPSSPELNNMMGNLFQDLDKTDDAISCYEQALAIDPNYSAAHQNLGVLSAVANLPQKSLRHFEAAQCHTPSAMNLMLAATVLPVIYESQEQLEYWRRRVEERVSDMVASGVVIDTTDALIPSSFHFAYHGKNDRPLMEDLAKIYRGVQCCDAAKEGGWRRNNKRIRVGFLSSHFCSHTIGNLNIGMVEQLPKEEFEVVVISLKKHADALSERFKRAADQYVVVSRSPRVARKAIAELKLDILVFTDVGMDALTQTLCYSRMAPVQAAMWGHPVTTGSPTIDYFISTNLAESDNAQEHYSEQLVRLPSLGVYYERPPFPIVKPTPESFGLPGGRNLYLCPQTLFKFHPSFDEVLAGILRNDPKGNLVLIASKKPEWEVALKARWNTVMPDVSDRVHFLAPMPRIKYLELLHLGDVMLDPFPFGGGNTSYEAIAMQTPIVTLSTDFLRGRLTSALQRRMQSVDAAIETLAQYVECATSIASDKKWGLEKQQQYENSSSILFSNNEDVVHYSKMLQVLCEN